MVKGDDRCGDWLGEEYPITDKLGEEYSITDKTLSPSFHPGDPVRSLCQLETKPRKFSTVQFNSRQYLCLRENPHVLHSVSKVWASRGFATPCLWQPAVNHAFVSWLAHSAISHTVLATRLALDWPGVEARLFNSYFAPDKKKWCPVLWRIQAPRAKTNHFSSLPSPWVWNLCKKAKEKIEDFGLE